MRIIIIGAGNAGRHLARTLCDLNHDVVVIEQRAEALAELEAQLDVLTLQGHGASPAILNEAQVEKADLVVAVTHSDEVNIMACAYAHAAGVKDKVARVSDPSYANGSSKLQLEKLGVDLTVSHKEECAREIFNIIRMPGTIEVVDLFNGEAVTLGTKVSTTSPLLRAPLQDFPDHGLIDKIRFIAAIRGDELMIPGGETQFLIGDDVYVVMRPEEIPSFIDWACPDHPTFEKVIVGGGGQLGLSVASRLEQLPLQVVLLEQDEGRADFCSAHLDKTLVIRGDLLDHETLGTAGIVEQTAFVAVTGDDENNIIGCLMAEKDGASFTLAQITKPEYAPIINGLSLLDRAISPHVSMTNAILHFVRGQHVRRAALLHNLPGELLEMDLPPASKWAGQAIQNVNMPKGAIVAAVLRDGTMHPATGSLVLRGGDRVAIFSLPETVDKVEARFHK